MTLDMPPLVENGNAVPLTVSVDSPMTKADYVKAIHVFNEKNPQPQVISVHLGPHAGRASVSTRIKLADIQKVVAIAETERRLVLERAPTSSSRSRPASRICVMARTLINVPPKAKRGEVIEIKTLISHPMESGYRAGTNGTLIPRDIITLSPAPITAPRCSAPSCRRQSRPIRSSRFSRSRPRAARSSSAGPATTGLQRPRRPRSPSNDQRLRIPCTGLSPSSQFSRRSPYRRRHPAGRAPLGLRVHGPRDPGDAGRRRRQPGHAGGARWRSFVEPRRGPGREILRQLPWRCARSMDGVAARYPAFDAALGRPVDLEQRINLCRTERQEPRRCPSKARSF